MAGWALSCLLAATICRSPQWLLAAAGSVAFVREVAHAPERQAADWLVHVQGPLVVAALRPLTDNPVDTHLVS